MRKILILVVAVLAIASLALAGGHRGRHHGKARVIEELQLSDAQRTQLEKMREKHRATLEPIRDAIRDAAREYRSLKEANDPRATEVREKIRDLREELHIMRMSFRGDFESILTPEQKVKLEARKNERRERR